jgi:hypothetical protein
VPPIRIHRAWVVLLGGLAGCYTPSLQEGAPCQRSEQCPEPQRCVLGNCSFREAPPIDARPPPPPDAAMDAPVDAMRLACSTAGLSCTGNVTMFTCGGNCWVKCTGAVLRATAETACTGWTGALGEIDDATEDSCVASHIATAAFWIGAIQGNGAMAPDDKWTWNGTPPLVYTNWATGKPDDADGVESGMEQCATIRPGGSWDDDNCNQPLAFFCERP